jgi:hypothetical protein
MMLYIYVLTSMITGFEVGGINLPSRNKRVMTITSRGTSPIPIPYRLRPSLCQKRLQYICIVRMRDQIPYISRISVAPPLELPPILSIHQYIIESGAISENKIIALQMYGGVGK